MSRIGYHCSHEQFAPGELLRLVQRAEDAGFQSAMCSDHYFPWSEAQGQSGFAWSWLGAALQATRLSFGVVTVPGGWRYHPAVLAQAAATLCAMFPGRFWMAPGSGEALNEHVVAERWPPKPERNARLREAVEIMRALWAGETVTHHGLLHVEDAKLSTLPPEPPQVVGPALTPETAQWLGGWADGLITTAQPREKLRAIVEAFRRGGGEGKPLFLQAQLAFARTEAEALRGAHEQWAPVSLPSTVLGDLRLPKQFEDAAKYVRPEDLPGNIRISADWERHVEWLHEDVEMGFVEINLHNVTREQDRFLDVFGEHALPALAQG